MFHKMMDKGHNSNLSKQHREVVNLSKFGKSESTKHPKSHPLFDTATDKEIVANSSL